MLTAAVVTVTTNRPELEDCIRSVMFQTQECKHYILVDGSVPWVDFLEMRMRYASDRVRLCYWDDPIGGNGWDGRKWLAAAPHLVKEDVTFFCNDDDWFHPLHVESIMSYMEQGFDWVYCLRTINEKDGTFLFNDKCEALGDLHHDWNNVGHHFVDWCMWGMKTNCLSNLSVIFNKKGYGVDREFYNIAKQMYPKYTSTRQHTFNFRLGGNPGSVTKEFFLLGHAAMKAKYGDKMPWENYELQS